MTHRERWLKTFHFEPVDHRVPPDVTYENYRYYLACKRETFGIPEPTPWEERRPADW